jgi:hypothetical protein
LPWRIFYGGVILVSYEDAMADVMEAEMKRRILPSALLVLCSLWGNCQLESKSLKVAEENIFGNKVG